MIPSLMRALASSASPVDEPPGSSVSPLGGVGAHRSIGSRPLRIAGVDPDPLEQLAARIGRGWVVDSDDYGGSR